MKQEVEVICTIPEDTLRFVAVSLSELAEDYLCMEEIPDGEEAAASSLSAQIDKTRETADLFFRMWEQSRSRLGIEGFQTCELVEELEKREGVDTMIAEPYQDTEIKVSGPATVLVVTD